MLGGWGGMGGLVGGLQVITDASKAVRAALESAPPRPAPSTAAAQLCAPALLPIARSIRPRPACAGASTRARERERAWVRGFVRTRAGGCGRRCWGTGGVRLPAFVLCARWVRVCVRACVRA